MPSQVELNSIEHAAQHLLREVGPTFTMDQLARATGLSRATLYRQVGGKDALLGRLDGLAAPVQALRTRILHAAVTVITDHGLLGSSMEQIAQRAGVGVATLYRHFGDKDALVRAAVTHATPRALLRQLTLSPTADLDAELTRLVGAVLSAMSPMRGLIRLSLFGSAAEQAYLGRVKQGTDRAVDLLARYLAAQQQAGHLRPEPAPRDLAVALHGLLFAYGVLDPLRSGAPLDDSGRVARRIVTLFLHGAATGGGRNGSD